MQPGRGARGVEGIEPAPEHRPGDAGEHVAHAAASHARIDAGHEMHAAAGRGDERPRPFQDHRLARDVHQPSQRAGAVRLDLLRAAGQQARRLPRMRREDHRHVALRERIGLVPDEVERVGVEHGSRRPAGVEEPDQGVQNTRLPRHSGSDDDRIADKGKPGCFERAAGRDLRIERQDHHLGRMGRDRVGDASRDGGRDQSRPGAQRAQRGQRRRAAIARAAADDAHMPEVALVRVPSATGSAPGHVAHGHELVGIGGGAQQRVGDFEIVHLDGAGVLECERRRQTRLGHAHAQRQIGMDDLARGGAGVRVEAGRDVDRDDVRAALEAVDEADGGGGGFAWRTLHADAQDAVQHHVAGRDGGRRHRGPGTFGLEPDDVGQPAGFEKRLEGSPRLSRTQRGVVAHREASRRQFEAGMDGVGAVVAVAEHDVDDRTDGVVALHLENEVGEALGGELDQTVGGGNSGKMTGRLQEFRVDRAHLGCGYVAHGVPGVIVEG